MPSTAQPSLFARLFSFSALLVGVFALFLFFLCIGRPLLADPDLWWHLRNAAQLLDGHSFPRTDLYTFSTGGKPWIDPEWLAELPYAAAWRHFGYRGLEVVTVAMIEAVTLGVFALSWQRAGNAKAALLACGLFLPMLSVSMGPRTLMFGWLCLIAELYVLSAVRESRNLQWGLPALFAVWINLHGSWPIGMVLLGVFIASGFFGTTHGSIVVERWTPAQGRTLLCVAGLCVVALFLNPYGWRLVAYPFHITFGHHVTTENVEEWQTLDFHAFRGRFLYGVVAALVLISTVRRRAWPLHEVLFVLVGVLAAFTYSRFLILAGIVVCPLLAREFSFFAPAEPAKDRPLLNLALIAVLVSIAATHIPPQLELRKQIAASYPVDAVEYLQAARPAGPIFNDLGWGGYLEWRLPATPAFIDSRADIFDERGVLQQYLDATAVRHTFEIFDSYGIQTVVFPRDAPIVYLLTHTAGWRTVYLDKIAIVLQRTDPG